MCEFVERGRHFQIELTIIIIIVIIIIIRRTGSCKYLLESSQSSRYHRVFKYLIILRNEQRFIDGGTTWIAQKGLRRSRDFLRRTDHNIILLKRH